MKRTLRGSGRRRAVYVARFRRGVMDEKQHHEKKNAFSHELGSRSSGTRKGSEKTPKHASFQAFRLDTATRSVLWAVSRAVAQDHLRVTEPPPRVMPASSSLTRKRAAVPASKLKKLGATKLSEVDAKSDPNARESCSGGSLAMRPPDRRGALADLPRVSHTFHDAGGAPEPTPAFEPGTPSPTVRHFARLFRHLPTATADTEFARVANAHRSSARGARANGSGTSPPSIPSHTPQVTSKRPAAASPTTPDRVQAPAAGALPPVTSRGADTKRRKRPKSSDPSMTRTSARPNHRDRGTDRATSLSPAVTLPKRDARHLPPPKTMNMAVRHVPPPTPRLRVVTPTRLRFFQRVPSSLRESPRRRRRDIAAFILR